MHALKFIRLLRRLFIGFANIPNTSEIGQWLVILNCTGCIPAPYWILELGPVNSDDLYDYAIVSDSVGLFLFVLARNVTEFNENYNEQVLLTLIDLGFVGPTKPIPTYQGYDCVYYDDRSDDANDDAASLSDSSNENTLSANVIIAVSVVGGIVVLALLLGYFYWTFSSTSKSSIRESLLEIGSQKSGNVFKNDA